MTKKPGWYLKKIKSFQDMNLVDITNLTYGAVSNWMMIKTSSWMGRILVVLLHESKENETLNTIINPIIARELRKRELHQC